MLLQNCGNYKTKTYKYRRNKMDKIVNKADPRRKGRYIFPNMAKNPSTTSINRAICEKNAWRQQWKGQTITISNENQFSLQT